MNGETSEPTQGTTHPADAEPGGMPVQLAAARLHLLPLTAEALDALIAGERERLEALTTARFAEPLTAPPLMEDALPFMRDRLRAAPEQLGWWPWLYIDQTSRQAVGSGGFSGPPTAEGAVTLGYAVYPEFEGRGYATEAAAALCAWALAQPGVREVRATIPPDHEPSLRVAHKIGMRQTGTATDPEAGEVLVFSLP